MKVPFRGFGQAIYGIRAEFGIQCPLLLRQLSLAIRVRTATRTILGKWEAWRDFLQTADESASLVSLLLCGCVTGSACQDLVAGACRASSRRLANLLLLIAWILDFRKPFCRFSHSLLLAAVSRYTNSGEFRLPPSVMVFELGVMFLARWKPRLQLSTCITGK